MIKRYYYMESTGKELIVSLKELCLGPMPLLWYNAGLYGIISREKVENEIEVLKDNGNLPVLDVTKNLGKFYWDETEKLDQKIGKLLTGK